MIAQQAKYLRLEPGLMAEFKGRAAIRWQQRKEVAQSRDILLQKWRQLKQQRSQAIFERAGNFEQIRHRIPTIFEPLHVRDPLRGFEHELEIGWHVGRP